ncbi:uncharacterized protein LOC128552843 [Mercenaria mercenaria]|uniref:uncharacterized protein LOC128552843 n=1 Tax=Mercenaria mercenaria TaxID=6596 RepID=UPI00234E59DE|nr:uncharacterized protein LOC128552843 [Mercenaria mercenaria]
MPDILANDPYTYILYKRAVEEGTEIDNNIRIMVIGCYGQGKTSLVRKLLQQPSEGVQTTNGIEVQRCTCSKDGVWETDTLEDLEVESSKRLAKVANAVELETNTVETFKEFGNEDTSENTDKEEDDSEERNSQSKQEININFPNQNLTPNLKLFSSELSRSRQKAKASTENDTTLNIWDFGGQFVYYATHQIFHSRKAVYILVFNIAEGLEKEMSDPDFPGRTCNMTMRDYIRFWVTSVHSFAGNENGEEPPIIMVGTHKDQLENDTDTDEVFEDIRKMFDGTSAINHFLPYQSVVSNKASSDEDIAELRKTIFDAGKKQANKLVVPAKWILLEKELKKIRNKKIISLDEVLQVDRENGCQVQTDGEDKTRDQIKLFLKYHHALGSFCYFDDRHLSEYVVLDPQFLIDAFSCIITSGKFCRVRPKLRVLWQKLRDTATLEPALIEEVWRERQEEESYFRFKDLLTKFLQRHHIISEVLRFDEKCATSPQRLGFYIVPSFLRVTAEDATIENFLKGKPATEVSVGYIFDNDSVTPTLYHKLLAAVIGKWPLLKFFGQYILFKNIAACELPSDHTGLLQLSGNKLEILVLNLCPPQSVMSDVCDMFRRFIEMVIDHEFCRIRGNEEHVPQQAVKKYVRCNHEQHGIKGSYEIHELNDMQPIRNLPCPDRASHSLEMNKILQQWFGHQDTIKDIPERRLTMKEYSTLSMGIGEGWQQIGLHLGLDDTSLQHISMDHTCTVMRIFSMFKKWDSKENDRATLDVLVKAIQDCQQSTTVNWDVVKNVIDRF